MATGFDLLRMRRILGRKEWGPPLKIGPDQWCFKSNISGSVIVSYAPFPTPGSGEVYWVHASISRKCYMPAYEDLKTLHEAVFNDGWAYQVFAPVARHINI